MKKLHLLSNAHLDPVWLWQWKEGAAEAISTFRIAADFCEQYDGFVFNHNEALLYEWVEEYEPELFERIKKLVKQGKWAIMGGWYLQPDCTMLSGESFLSQIELGRKYFKDKFGVEPKTAVNFDPFGHTKGLVQILEKTGYDSYIFMRPQKYPKDFVWKGFADSRVIGHCIYGGYNTLKGYAITKLEKEYLVDCKNEEIGLMTWGIGNHGGGPSKIDLENLNKAIKEHKDVEIIHSTAENYFNDLDKTDLPHIDTSLKHVMMGCYTSMTRIKAQNRLLENKLLTAQKMATYASLTRNMQYPENDIRDIRKNLAFCQFHDIMPGSCIKPAEEDALRTQSYALEKCDKIIAKAFFLLAKGQKEAKEGEIPIMIFNPHPYKIKKTFEVGFMLQNQNWNGDEITIATVYDENGNRLMCQNEKPEATFSLDWIENVVFEATLQPSCMNRFDCKLTVIKKEEKAVEYTDKIVVDNGKIRCVIDRNTGMIEEYSVNGVTKIKNSGVIEVYNDNEDPWGMTVDGFYDKIGEFKLLNEEETSKFLGYDGKTQNVIITEDGEVRTKVEAFFKYEESFAVIEYYIDKLSLDLDIKITIYSNNANKCIKYRLDTAVKNGEFYGQTAFGVEKLENDMTETTYHKWCGIENENNALYVINNSMYAGSFKDQSMYLTLLRTPVYSAHPIGQRQIAPKNRFLKHIDMGERTFSLKITASADYEKKALVFNEEPVAISYFPHEEKFENSPCVVVDNENIQISLIKREEDKIILHLFNSSKNIEKATVKGLFFDDCNVTFKGYELKFTEIKDRKLIETDII